MQDVYKNIEQYNPNRKIKVLIVFADMITKKKIQQRETELFIRAFFVVPKNISLNSAR